MTIDEIKEKLHQYINAAHAEQVVEMYRLVESKELDQYPLYDEETLNKLRKTSDGHFSGDTQK